MAVKDAKLKLKEEERGKIGVFIGAVQVGGEFGERQYITLLEKGAHKVSPFLGTIFYLYRIRIKRKECYCFWRLYCGSNSYYLCFK